MNLSEAILTDHARTQMASRGIDVACVRQVLSGPEEVRPVRPGRVVAQAMIDETHLLRVFVDIDRKPAEIVTAYITSRLDKYRSQS